MDVLKEIGCAILFLFLIVVGIIIFIIIMVAPSGNIKMPDAAWVVKNADFQRLNSEVLRLDSIENIAVLTKSQYFVIDSMIINQDNKTFGFEPVLGFYASYYEEGDKTSYSSLDSLFKAHHLKIDTAMALSIIEQMKQLKIADIFIEDSTITYGWKVSAMYGEEGILYSKYKVTPHKTGYDLLEKIGEDMYHFAVYDH